MARYISGSSARSLLIGLVAVSVIAVGAATIGASVDIEPGTASGGSLSGGSPVSDGNDSFDGNGTGGPVNDSQRAYDFNLTTCIELLDSIPGMLGYFGLAGGVFYGIKRRYSTGSAMMAAFGLSPFVIAGYFMTTDCVSLGGGGGDGPIPTPSPGPLFSIPDVPPLALVGVVGLLLVVSAAVVVRATGDQYDELEEEAEDEEGPDVSDLAEAAGAAADRLEKHNADVDNAVYRAWWEMTQLLDVPNPDSATPGEFAAAAVDVGLGEEHVDELTTLFEEVRYGQRDAEAREEHAIEVFRTIESEYGTDTGASFEIDSGEAGDGGDGQ